MKNPVPRPFYQLQVHTKTFRHKSLPIQQRIKSEYLPKYWRRLKMDQKIIKPNEQDRLSRLTTIQIDRIIDMEKIKHALRGKKNGNEQLFLDKYKPAQNTHPNVYRANFLSKVNKIAIQRRIFPEQAEGFESIYGQPNPQSIRRRELQKQKENTKYIKVYRSSHQTDKNKLSMQQMLKKNEFFIQDQKSIQSISDRDYMEHTDHKLAQSKTMANAFRRNKSYKDDGKLLCSRRWFDGMSTFYLEKKQFLRGETNEREYRGVDIEAMVGKVKKGRTSQMFFCNRVKTEATQLSTIRDRRESHHLITSSLESLF